MPSVDAMMKGVGKLRRAEHNVVWGPGRHTAGDNTFSYFISPGQFVVGYTSELVEVDDDAWQASVHTPSLEVMDQWGYGEGGPKDMPEAHSRRPALESPDALRICNVRVFPQELRLEPVGRHRHRERRADRRDRRDVPPCATQPRGARTPALASSSSTGWPWPTSWSSSRAEDEAKGRNFSAGKKLQRASLYYITAERACRVTVIRGGSEPVARETREAVDRAMRLGRENARRVEIPYEGGVIPGVLTRAPGEGRRRRSSRLCERPG
ncbi:hypothetical protein ACRAWD_31980 [Caulobacter segnis]